jgi:hypothetical protein
MSLALYLARVRSSDLLEGTLLVPDLNFVSVRISDVRERIAWSKFTAPQQATACCLCLLYRRVNVLRPDEAEPKMGDTTDGASTSGRVFERDDIVRTRTFYLY